ncbi:unnamed protein product [Camellia sinensis]
MANFFRISAARRALSEQLSHSAMAFFGRGTLLSKKSVRVEKKWSHPIYIIGHDKTTGSSHADRLNYIASLASIASFGTYLGYYLAEKPPLLDLEGVKAVVALGTAIQAQGESLQEEMTTIGSNIETIKKDIQELKQKKSGFRFCLKFLEGPELQNRHIKRKCDMNEELEQSILINSTRISWDASSLKPTLADINLVVQFGEKIAVCGEVGSGKSTLIATILGEVPNINNIVQVHGKVAYVSQTAWIQTGTIQENILFGSNMDKHRYHEVLEKCSLIKDLELLPFGDCTIIGERGVNLSGGQKQRVQLVRALYQDADVYLLDDPFSAVDAHTATSLFNEYVMGALAGKTVLLVTHQVGFLPTFDSILLMFEGKIVEAATYNQLLACSQQFQNLVNAHKDTVGSEKHIKYGSPKSKALTEEIQEGINTEEQLREPLGDQLITKEEREIGDTGLKPYIQYLNQSTGFLYLSWWFLQSLWLAVDVQDSSISRLKLILVYSLIGCGASIFLLLRSYLVVALGLSTSKSIFSKLMTSLFQAPMSFYDSTPSGRILSPVSSDLSVVDLELAFNFNLSIGSTWNTI